MQGINLMEQLFSHCTLHKQILSQGDKCTEEFR